MNNVYTLLLAPRPAGEARATSIPGSMQGASNKASGPAGRSPEGRGGGRASAALPLLDDDTTSPASRRLASARPALAPKCKRYSLTDPYEEVEGRSPCPRPQVQDDTIRKDFVVLDSRRFTSLPGRRFRRHRLADRQTRKIPGGPMTKDSA